jgi:hypothetical protein
MKFVEPLDVVAHYLHRGYSVEFMDTDPDRLNQARKLRLKSGADFKITDASNISGAAQPHYDVCIAVNTEDFHPTIKGEWLVYAYQSIEFFV